MVTFTPLMKILIALVLLYLLITVFMKFTKLALRVIIVVLIIGIFVFGYGSVSELLDKPPKQKFQERFGENATVEPVEEPPPDVEDLDKELEELDELEKDLEEPEEVNVSEVNVTVE